MSIKSFLEDKTASSSSGVVGFYMTILVASIVVMSVVMPVAFDQITTLTECEGVAGGNCSIEPANITGSAHTVLDLLGLLLAMSLLILYMRPLM